MNRHRTSRFVAVAAPTIASLWLATCGGDGSGGGEFSTPLPGGAKISSLNQEERSQLCESVRSWGKAIDDDFAANWCKAHAVDEGIAVSCGDSSRWQPECRISLDECTKKPMQEIASVDCKPNDTCAATVAQVVQCFNDGAALQHAYFQAYPSCNLLTEMPKPDLGDLEDRALASCRRVLDLCRGGFYRLPLGFSVPVDIVQITGITVMPAEATLSLGAELQFSGVVESDKPRLTACRKLTWISGTPSVVAIGTTSGLARALKPGTATITAGDGIIMGTAKVTVTP